MKLKMSKEWFLKNIAAEDKAIVSAGLFSMDKLNGIYPSAQKYNLIPMLAFGLLINLSRRNKNLTMEELADQAKVDLDELVNIEEAPGFIPEVPTVHKLASALNLPLQQLLELSGNKISKDFSQEKKAIRFVARSQGVDKLTKEEYAAWEEFVQSLNEA